MPIDTEAARPNVLVAAASKHGSTTEIAGRIGDVLESRGVHVTVAPADQIPDVSMFDAIVLGSAIYAGHWRDEAKELADRIGDSAENVRVWLFSSGPLGDPPFPEEDPIDARPVIEKTRAIEHKVFSGRLDKTDLSFGEKAVVKAVRAPDGDFRDWTEIESWAESIATQLAGADQVVES